MNHKCHKPRMTAKKHCSYEQNIMKGKCSFLLKSYTHEADGRYPISPLSFPPSGQYSSRLCVRRREEERQHFYSSGISHRARVTVVSVPSLTVGSRDCEKLALLKDGASELLQRSEPSSSRAHEPYHGDNLRL